MSDATKIHVGDVLAQALCDTTPRKLYERAVQAERRAEAAEARERALRDGLERDAAIHDDLAAQAVSPDTAKCHKWIAERLRAHISAALAQQPAYPVVSQNDADLGHDAACGSQDVGDTAAPGEPFQTRVWPWLIHCFGETIARDGQERNHRFLEEALELVQSTGCTAGEAHQLVDYVFGRPVGEPHQETGGVMVTLAALCLAHDLDMHAAGEDELTRVWEKADKIRAKQAAKPAHGPLPGPSEADKPAQGERLDAVYLIRTENGLWRPNARGYTNSPAEAGRYTHEEAKRHTRGLGPEKQARIIHEDDLTPADKPTCCQATEAHTLERAAREIESLTPRYDRLSPCAWERGVRQAQKECAAAIRNLRGDQPAQGERLDPHTRAAADVVKERRRQVTAEGYDESHDDEHAYGELARAASVYAGYAADQAAGNPRIIHCPLDWPWHPKDCKLKDPRSNLVRAGALILAEIERLDRNLRGNGGDT